MHVSVRGGCCRLEVLVYTAGMVLTLVYLFAGLGGVVWFVLSHSEDTSALLRQMEELEMLRVGSMRGSLALMAGGLVISFLGLLTCLLLVVGVRTQQRLLLLPWQLYHATLILACVGGGFYQALHFTVLAEKKDTLRACLALFPVVAGIFFIFLWVLVHQLALRLRYRRQLEAAVEEKRASLSIMHQAVSLPRTLPTPAPSLGHRSVRSVRSLKRRPRVHSADYHIMRQRSRSLEQMMLPGEEWDEARSRSLPRTLSQSKYQDRPLSDKLRRRAEYMDSERAELIERISQTESLHRRRSREGPARSAEGGGRSVEGLGRTMDGPLSGRLGEDFGRLLGKEGWPPSSSSSSGRERSCGTSQQALGSLRSVSIHPQVEVIPRAVLKKDQGRSGDLSLRGGEEGETWKKGADEAREERVRNFLSDLDTTDCYTVPTPIYPGAPSPSHLTRHQIIDLYCR